MKKQLTCIICPKGCLIDIEFEQEKIKKVSGYTCKRGLEYATNEITNPLRTITSTISVKQGGVVSVKTNKPIPKEKTFECMQEINKIIVSLPIHMGEVIIKNILNTGADLVATQEII